MTAEEIQYNKMTKTKINKLIITLGIPTVISMLITAIYNIADTFFVSQLGKSASGAVGVVFSLMAIIQAVGFTFGMGAGSLISAKLGQRKEEEAQVIGSSAFYIAIVIGIIIGIFSLMFIDPLMKLLGSTDTALPYAREYARYIIYGFPIMVGSFVMNNILRAEGKAKFSMIGLTTGGLLNIALDPLFIYVFNLGISGAAIATIISQGVSFIILLTMFLIRKSIIRLSISKVTKNISTYLEIVKVGLPSFCRQGLASIATILLNTQAGIYGDDAALSAMSIVSKVLSVIFSICLGIGQGYQPVCGYNYSAKKYDRVKEATLFTLKVSSILMTLFAISFFIFSKQIVSFFIDDNDVIEIGVMALRFQCISMPFMSLNVVCNMTFQSIRQKTKATILSCYRQGLFFIPLTFVLPTLFKLTGVELIQAISDILSFVFTIPFFIIFIRELNEKIKKMDEQNKPSVLDL